jgi:UrcA family protein
MRRATHTALLAAVATAAAQLALADSSYYVIPMQRVDYSDIDLSRAAGANALYERLQTAAREVCRPLDSEQLALHKHYVNCRTRAVADAVARIDNPLLTALHEFKTGLPAPATLMAGAPKQP